MVAPGIEYSFSTKVKGKRNGLELLAHPLLGLVVPEWGDGVAHGCSHFAFGHFLAKSSELWGRFHLRRTDESWYT